MYASIQRFVCRIVNSQPTHNSRRNLTASRVHISPMLLTKNQQYLARLKRRKNNQKPNFAIKLSSVTMHYYENSSENRYMNKRMLIEIEVLHATLSSLQI